MPYSPSFPPRRSSDLHEHDPAEAHPDPHEVALARTGARAAGGTSDGHRHGHRHLGTMPDDPFMTYGRGTAFGVGIDRKSTRLNSSHRCISYAVLCLKN